MSSRKGNAEFAALIETAEVAAAFARDVATATAESDPALSSRALALAASAASAASVPNLKGILSRPRVGVAAVLRCRELHGGDHVRVLVGARVGAHGAGRVATPGGHPEHGEAWGLTASREAEEETGLAVDPSRFSFLACTNDVMPDDGMHYITIFMKAEITKDEAAKISNVEPDKCAGWEWLSPDEITARGSFIPLANLIAAGHLRS